MFLKQNRYVKIKGRKVPGGNKHRDCISKEDYIPPTAETGSMLLIYIIDAKRKRDIKVIDIPNDFIQTQIEHEKYIAIINICRILANMLLYIAPDVYGL